MPGTLIAGNWKMHGFAADLHQIRDIVAGLPASGPRFEALICVPATLVSRASAAAFGSRLLIGGETCHPQPTGAHTGEISAEMLKDAGASHVIVGHSERRRDHGERDADVAAQAVAALRASLVPIICVGETLAERDAGATLDVISRQIHGSLPAGAGPGAFVIAYEPVWAIGTGRVASVEQIGEVHQFIRNLLLERFGPAGSTIRQLYGGSMSPANAAGILQVPNVNGGLIGGASLKAADFLSICYSASKEAAGT